MFETPQGAAQWVGFGDGMVDLKAFRLSCIRSIARKRCYNWKIILDVRRSPFPTIRKVVEAMQNACR